MHELPRRGIFSETPIQVDEILSVRTGASTLFVFDRHRSQPQYIVVRHKYSDDPLQARSSVLYAIDMTQPIDERDRSNAGTPHDILRLTVPDAAHALGISPEAVRNRLSRGTLNSEKEDGTVYVLLPADKVRHIGDRSQYTIDRPNGTSQHIGDTFSDIPENSASLISAKDETIRVLSEQLEAERMASSELRRIVAGLVQRVPELEPARDTSPEPRDSPVPSSEGDGKVEETPSGTEQRSWWQRWFGG
jgi:hypothetical protein